ncbi:SIMPL domain-containing protein [Glacieibacterium frigidum]|uniref:SIMPL domain-containing protein n=1 Tax=Glacieibacterium frigidum TaxID=2593303 RepID=A0A552U7J1_9SPHN|nr:SIMPL domain-containing protein [Glacieibacterium frigidum]TRW14188.1 SIMPL domain-containing protein [Glacieibacterium frigidum]
MRASILCAAAALFAAAPLAAQAPGPVALSPGEVLAQVSGSGQVRSRPDEARIRLTLSARADTDAAARQAGQTALRDLRARLRDAGVPEAAITVLPSAEQMGFVGNEAYGDDDTADTRALMAVVQRRKTAKVGVQIGLTDMSQLAAVRRILLEMDNVIAQPAMLSLRDERPARGAAITEAIAKARAEADAYASALGLRVGRIVRVFNPAATVEQPPVWAQMAALVNGSRGDEVVTDARVGMDVVLVAR